MYDSKLFSHVQLFATPQTIQSTKEFSRPEYWSGQSFPSSGDLPNPGIESRSPALQADSLPAESQGKLWVLHDVTSNQKNCHFEVSSSLKMQAATTNHFSTRLLSAMKSRFYMTTSDDQLNGWAEKNLQSTSQSQTCTKKMSWSLFGGLLPI